MRFHRFSPLRTRAPMRRRYVMAACLSATVAACAMLTLGSLSAIETSVDQGRELFVRKWSSQHPDARHGDGLGPLFNARSCAECHRQRGVGGSGPNESNVQLINTRFIDFFGEKDPGVTRTRWFPFAVNGVMVLHRHGTAPGYDQLRLQRLQWAMPQHPEVQHLPPIQREVVIRCFCGVGRPPSPLEERNTPALFGAGLIDRVSLSTLQEIAAAQEPMVRGRPPILADGSLGRFGWKGQNATLRDFCENACTAELGLETSRRKDPARTFVRREPGKPLPVGSSATVPDITDQEVADMTAFVASLPAPRQIVPNGAKGTEVELGAAVFEQIGCAACHTPNVGHVRGIYGDLLFHRIGTSGSGFYGVAPQPVETADKIMPPAADEFRTPPLWGLADSAPYLHDGSAPTIDDAIRRHQDQAMSSLQRYLTLSATDRRMLTVFFQSLRAPVIQ